MNNPGSMWALTQTGPCRLKVDRTPRPTEDSLCDGEVLIRSLVGGICGSDLPYFQGHRAPDVPAGTPGFPLHEVVGEVVASRFAHIDVGQTVVGWATRSTGLAEYVVSAGHSLHAFSSAFSAEEAILLQPLACVVYAAEQIGDVADKSVAVLGVGPIGALFTHVLKRKGASKVTGVDRVDRSDVRFVLGMDEFVHSDVSAWAAELEEADRPNQVVEAVGHQVETLTVAVQAASWQGSVYYFGINNDPVYPFPLQDFLRKNMTLKSGTTPISHRRWALAQADAYLSMFPELIGPYLASKHPFQDAEQAFLEATRPQRGQLKVSLVVD